LVTPDEAAVVEALTESYSHAFNNTTGWFSAAQAGLAALRAMNRPTLLRALRMSLVPIIDPDDDTDYEAWVDLSGER
jgi:hypothetical protein